MLEKEDAGAKMIHEMKIDMDVKEMQKMRDILC